MSKSILTRLKRSVDEELKKQNKNYFNANEQIDYMLSIMLDESEELLNLSTFKKDVKDLISFSIEAYRSSLEEFEKGKIINGITFSREGVESLLCGIVLQRDDDFEFNNDLTPGKVRKKIKNNPSFFSENFDLSYFEINSKEKHALGIFYSFLSKLVHPTPLKLKVLKLERNSRLKKEASNYFKENLIFAIEMLIVYLNPKEKYKNDLDKLFFVEYHIKHCADLSWINILYFIEKMRNNQIDEYMDIYKIDIEKNFVKNCTKSTERSKKSREGLLKFAFREYEKEKVEKLYKKYGYTKYL